MTATVPDVEQWGNLALTTPAAIAAMDRLLSAIKAEVDERLQPGWADTAAGTAAVDQAVIMLAARRWARRDTPNGVVGFGGAGEVVRVGRYDPDIEALLSQWAHGPLL